MCERSESQSADRIPRFALVATALLCLFVITFVYVSRLCGPADLFRKDQAKTMAYTGSSDTMRPVIF